MTEKRFRVTIGKNNSVALIDVVDNVRLMYIQFSNKEAAVSCRSSLVHQCELMNTLYEENEELKQQLEDCEIKKQNHKEMLMHSEAVVEQKELQKLIYGQVIALIDMRIKAYEHRPFSAPVSNPANPNYDPDVDRLARLSELQELKRELKGDVE